LTPVKRPVSAMPPKKSIVIPAKAGTQWSGAVNEAYLVGAVIGS
jgi:hypothetical protein